MKLIVVSCLISLVLGLTSLAASRLQLREAEAMWAAIVGIAMLIISACLFVSAIAVAVFTT
jgi:hypothetical protein